jgi:hypothetical protein
VSLLALLVAASAAATSPGGWRVQAASPESTVAVRPVIVLGDPVANVAQATLDARFGRGPAAVDLQLPWVYAWNGADGWARGGPGLLRMGAYGWLLHEHLQVGLEFALPVTSADRTARSWGSHSFEVLPDHEIMAIWQGQWSSGRVAVTTRAGLGARWGPYALAWLSAGSTTMPIFEHAVAVACGLAGPFGVVAEGEIVADPYVPLTVRPLLRMDLGAGHGRFTLDVGVQLPVPGTMGGRMTFQPIAQVRWYPVLDWPWPGTHPDSAR